MAQDPDMPLDDGKIRMPRYGAGQNRIGPSAPDKGTDDRSEMLRPGPTKRTDEEEQELLRRARKRFERCSRAEADIRKEGLDDDKFYSGDQWPTSVLTERAFDKRPAHTINKLPTFVHQVTNAHREERPAPNINPVGDRADLESAKVFRGMVRAIERDSRADIAYDTSFESTSRKGWGYWRVMTEWERPDSYNQVIVIRRVRNAYTVYMDPNHKEPDGSDARYAFVTEMVPRDDFKEQFPGKDPINWQEGGFGDEYKEWVTQESIRIAEYYELEYEKRTLALMPSGEARWKDELDERVLKDIVDTRESDVPKITWFKITGREILEEQEWPGQWIPIVKQIGDEVDIDGKVRQWGIVRFAKDPQRQYNYWNTAETELVALAPKAPWVLAEGQDEGYEQEWKTANIRSHPVLHYRPQTFEGHAVPPPQRQQFAQVPAGVTNARQSAAQDMMAVTGIRFDATLQERVYDESGRALRELRRSGDIGSFHFTDNFAISLRHSTEIIVDLIPKIYERKQIITILRDDDKEEAIMLDPTAPKALQEGDQRDPVTDKVMRAFNPNVGRYGVTATIGPSYATKRVEAAESMMDFVKAMPQAGQLVMDLIAKNQDWPEAEQFATRLAKALPPGMIQPEMKDVPPQVQALLQQMQQQIQQMTQERTAMMKQLMDQEADRAQRQDKIDKDFEAKLLAVIQKAEAAVATHIGSQLKDLAEGVNLLRDTLASPPPAANGKANG